MSVIRLSSYNFFQDYTDATNTVQKPDTIVKQITNLGKLENGWDFGEGESISEAVINKTVELYLLSLRYGLVCTVHPTSCGGITLVFSAKDYFLDITIQSDLTLILTKEKGVGYEYRTLYSDLPATTEKASQELGILSTENCLECISSEPFKFENTSLLKADFKVIVSSHSEPEFRLSTTNA